MYSVAGVKLQCIGKYAPPQPHNLNIQWNFNNLYSMEDLIFSHDNKVFLNTQLTASGFAKARFSESMNQEGTVAVKTETGYKFSPWKFTETSEDENNFVLLSGNLFNGTTLKQKLETSGQEEKIFLIAQTITMLENAVSSDFKIDLCGAGGIFISQDNTSFFIPPAIFFSTSASICSEKDFSHNQGFYIQPLLTQTNRLRFMQGVLAYKALTGNFPFDNLNAEQRREDIRDKNFKNINQKISGVERKLSLYIDNALSQPPMDKKVLDVLAASPFPLELFYKECGLTEQGTIPENGKLNFVEHKTVTDESEFLQKEKSISKKRWLRRHSTSLTAAAISLAVIIAVALAYFHSYMKKPTTKTLTSAQTVEMYFTGLNTLNYEYADTCVTGKKMKQAASVISNIYISGKQLSVYDIKADTVPLSKWLCYNKLSYSIFGISQFEIDGKPAETFFNAPLKDSVFSTKVSVPQETTATHHVSFFLVDSQTEQKMQVTKTQADVTLIFQKDRWLIQDLQSQEETAEFEKAEFFTDYKDAVENNEFNEAINILRSKYDFISTDEELEKAAALISEISNYRM